MFRECIKRLHRNESAYAGAMHFQELHASARENNLVSTHCGVYINKQDPYIITI